MWASRGRGRGLRTVGSNVLGSTTGQPRTYTDTHTHVYTILRTNTEQDVHTPSIHLQERWRLSTSAIATSPTHSYGSLSSYTNIRCTYTYVLLYFFVLSGRTAPHIKILEKAWCGRRKRIKKNVIPGLTDGSYDDNKEKRYVNCIIVLEVMGLI